MVAQSPRCAPKPLARCHSVASPGACELSGLALCYSRSVACGTRCVTILLPVISGAHGACIPTHSHLPPRCLAFSRRSAYSPSASMGGAKRSAPAASRAGSSKDSAANRPSKKGKVDKTFVSAEKAPIRADSRRRLDRRATDEQVERILAKKLYPKFPRELIEGSVAEDGSTPRSMISEEVRMCRNSQEYLKQEFWVKFFAKFPFHKGIVGMIPEPKGRGEIRPEVLEAIAPMHDKNPAKRHAGNLISFLATTSPLTERELFGIIMTSQPSETVTSDMYKKAMFALMRYVFRIRVRQGCGNTVPKRRASGHAFEASSG